MMKLPHILTIAKDPLSEIAVAEMQKLILLLLGCAVQCDKKEVFIERIKQLELDVQHAIVVYIQEVGGSFKEDSRTRLQEGNGARLQEGKWCYKKCFYLKKNAE